MEYTELAKAISKNLVFISRNLINCSIVNAHLLQENVITKNEMDEIEVEKTDFDKNRKLCLFLLKKPHLELMQFQKILSQSGNNDVAEVISGKKTRHVTEKALKPVCFNFEPNVPSFTGREVNLAQIEHTFRSKTTDMVNESEDTERMLRNVVVITSLGGMGKSEIAKRFIEKSITDVNTDIVWIPSENISKCRDMLIDLAKTEYKIELASDCFEDAIKEVYSHIVVTDRKAIFIFDNITKYQQEFLPQYCSIHPGLYSRLPMVLFTTRTAEFIQDAEEIVVEPLTEDEAVKLLKKTFHKKVKQNDEEMKELCKTLEYFPLALQQAIGYINKYWRLRAGYTIKSYLDEYKEKSDMLLKRGFKPGSNIYYEFTTAVTWQISFDKISEDKRHGKDAIRILTTCAYLAPTDIAVQMVLNVASEHDEPIDEEAVYLPFEVSMYKLEYGVITIHKLTQEVMRNQVKGNNEEEKLLDVIVGRLHNSITKENLKDVQHLISAWDYAAKYDNLLIKYKMIPNFVISKLKELGRYHEAESFSAEAIKQLMKRHDKTLEDDIIFELQYKNGKLKYKLEDFDGALKCFEKLLPISKNIPGKELKAFKIKMHMGIVYSKMAEYIKAENLLASIIPDIPEVLLSQDEKFMFKIKSSLAYCLTCLGRFKESESYYKMLFSNNTHILEKISSETLLNVKLDYAKVLSHLGDFEKAKEMYMEFMGVGHKQMEIDVPHKKVIHGLADLYVLSDQKEMALQLYQENYICCKEKFSTDHPYTVLAKQKIGEIYLQMGNYNKASEILDEIFEIQKLSYKENDPLILDCMVNIANLEASQNNLEEALYLYEDVVRIYNTAKDEKVENRKTKHGILKVQMEIAKIYFRLQSYDKSVKILEELLVVLVEVLGEFHPYTLETKTMLKENFRVQQEEQGQEPID